MTQGVFTGVITQIGAGRVLNGQLTTASVIEIGGHTLRDVSYDNFISTYLTKAIDSGEPVTLIILDDKTFMPRILPAKMIVGLKLNGKKYCIDNYDKLGNAKINAVTWFEAIVLGLFTFGVGGVALLLFRGYHFNKQRTIILPLKAEFERAST